MVCLSIHNSFWFPMLHSYTMRNILLYIPFLQALLTLFIKVYNTVFIKYSFEQNITIFSSIAHGFFTILTSEMINDLKDAASKKEHLSEQNFLNIFLVNHYWKHIRPNVHYFRLSLR